jgi:hypothetical protein
MGVARIRSIPYQHFFVDDGTAVLAGGKIHFYSPGTTTDKAIYKDSGKAAEHTNPVILDSSGHFPTNEVFADGIYDVVIKTSADVTLRTVSNWGDDYSAVGTSLANILSNSSFETAGSGGEAFANWTETDSGSVITRSTADQTHGVASCLFTASASSADYITSDLYEFNELYEMNIEFSVKCSNAACKPKIVIEWFDSASSSISTSTVYHDDAGIAPTSWTAKGSSVTPAANTCYFKAIIYGNTDGTTYNTNIDDVRVTQVSKFGTLAPYVPYGLQISRDAGDTSHDLKITAGAVKSADFADDMFLLSDIVKQGDAAFAEGTAAGGGGTGFSLPASGMFAVWLIKDPNTGHVDVAFDTSFSSPSLPAGYSIKRLIGGWMTDSSNNLISGDHTGMEFDFYAEMEDVADSTLTTTVYETGTFTCPPNCIAKYGSWSDIGFGGSNYQASDYRVNVKPTGSDYSTGNGVDIATAASEVDDWWFESEIRVDGSSQASYAAYWTYITNDPTPKLYIYTLGWRMLTRNDPV